MKIGQRGNLDCELTGLARMRGSTPKRKITIIVDNRTPEIVSLLNGVSTSRVPVDTVKIAADGSLRFKLAMTALRPGGFRFEGTVQQAAPPCCRSACSGCALKPWRPWDACNDAGTWSCAGGKNCCLPQACNHRADCGHPFCACKKADLGCACQ